MTNADVSRRPPPETEWGFNSRQLEPDENVRVRELLEKMDADRAKRLIDSVEELEKFRWALSFLSKVVAWSTAVGAAIWTLRDAIARVVKAVFQDHS